MKRKSARRKPKVQGAYKPKDTFARNFKSKLGTAKQFGAK